MKRFAVIPTGNREADYLNVIAWCKVHQVIPITIATSDDAKAYAVGKTINDRGLNISHWWNLGISYIREKMFDVEGEYTVAILNDDVILPDDWQEVIEKAIKDGATGASGGRPSNPKAIQGFAFMLNGRDDMSADERFVWWYGDTDLQLQCEQERGFTIVPGVDVPNLYAFSTNKRFARQIHLDSLAFDKKWSTS